MVKITEKQDTIILSLQNLCLILILYFGARMIVSMNASKAEDAAFYTVQFLVFSLWGFSIASIRYFIIWEEKPPDGPIARRIKNWLKKKAAESR